MLSTPPQLALARVTQSSSGIQRFAAAFQRYAPPMSVRA